METMLTPDDLKAISEIIKETVPPMLDELEGRMNVKFDVVQESLDGIENKIVTKDYLDRKLPEFVKKPA
mgnify:CR=1 FL=1